VTVMAQILRQIDDPALSSVERARLRCELARELTDSGKYEAAREAMSELWQRVGERPRLDGLDRHTAAEVLLRAGALTGWIGSKKQIEGAQELAKDLISESVAIFESLHDQEKVAEAQIGLSTCYWREGAFDEARVTLQNLLSWLDDSFPEHKAKALLNCAIIEVSSNRFNDALILLMDAAPFFESSQSHIIRGRFHSQLALVLKKLSESEGRKDYTDRALLEYEAASFHFEEAGFTMHRAVVENNLGFLFFTLGRIAEAHEHLDRARSLFNSLKDTVHTAQVNETRARVFLAEGRTSEAEKFARAAVRTLGQGDESSLLSEALSTHGVALARLGQHEEARSSLRRALEAAEQAGDHESAGLAAIATMEELSERLSADEMSSLYERADALLARSKNTETINRLRGCAPKVIEAGRARLPEFSAPSFVYAEERTGEFLRSAHLVAGTQGTVLITGETGTGKDVLARLIHEWSGRTGPFIAVNCGALTETPLESQLFGHVRGSSVDALEDQTGAVREAAGGTLFLDDIAELSLGNQGKLLRLIEHGEIHPVGASLPVRVDVRVLASASCDLKDSVARKEFRDDLFYRLSTFHLHIPPLRERPADIPALAAHFLKELMELYHKRVTFMPEALEAMRSLPLEGNARELRALIERTVIAARDESVITRPAVEAVAARQTKAASLLEPWAGCSLREEVLRYESQIVRLALESAGGSVTHAARMLGITHQRLCAMLQSRHKSLLLAKKATRPRKRRITTRLSH
jgi:DNA-binding NtrC family response regulator/tetratricopeptide (TPR) repeat protein